MRTPNLIVLAGAAVFSSGCSGLIGPSGDSETPDAPAVPTDWAPPSASATPGPASLKLLRTWEYEQSVADLLGMPTTSLDLRPDLVRAQFTSVSASADCYDDIAVETRERLALELSATAFAASPTPLDRAGCSPTSAQDACVRDFVAQFGRRAWRRALTTEEVDKYTALGGTLAALYDGDAVKGTELALAGLLLSPNFLYRVELGQPDPGGGEDRRYSSEEMASRLSFALWGRAPDEALLAAGAAGELDTADGVRRWARRLLDDSRAQPELTRFWREHLNVDRLTLTDFPKSGGSEDLYRSMRDEAEALIDRVVAPGADAMVFLTADRTYVDDNLAGVYGIAHDGAPGDVPLPAERRGFLTSGLFLATMSHPAKNSPVRRGRFVLDRLLCTPIPSPPADVDVALPSVPEGQLTLREQLSAHVENPTCRACHIEMDPIGYSFERFGPLGALRDLDNGLPIDASGTFRGVSFVDARGLIDAVAADPELSRCLVLQSRRFLTGDLENARYTEEINDLIARFDASGREFRSLVVEIVASDSFRYARGLAGGTE